MIRLPLCASPPTCSFGRASAGGVKTRLAAILLGALACAHIARHGSAFAPACEPAPEGILSPSLDARNLAGEYAVSMHLSGYDGAHLEQWRLWLWPTSSRDSSSGTGLRAEEGDTAMVPLYGTAVREENRADATDEARLRAGVDPVYPPVLVRRGMTGAVGAPPAQTLIMLVGTAGNRRDGVMVYDGAGSGMWIREVTRDGFRGHIAPWGIVMSDTGYFCARRIAHGPVSGE